MSKNSEKSAPDLTAPALKAKKSADEKAYERVQAARKKGGTTKPKPELTPQSAPTPSSSEMAQPKATTAPTKKLKPEPSPLEFQAPTPRGLLRAREMAVRQLQRGQGGVASAYRMATDRMLRGGRISQPTAESAQTTKTLERPARERQLEELLSPAPALPPAPLAELAARDISAWFGDHQVLDRVSLSMPAGVITSLIGPSGCGKSTFLRILNRMHELIPAASLAGEVLLDGVDIYDPDRRLVDARKSIGMVFQKPNPFPAMSIYDNVIAGLKLTGIHADRDRKDYLVETSLTKAGLWKEVRDRLRAPGGGLSGGQQQRLCIARSLAVSPRVLLMDEPCSALDPTSTRVIEETMLELAKEVTIVIVTHNMQQAQRVSTQCAFFLASQGKPGGIVEHGDTEAMFSSPIDSRTFDYVNGVFG